MFSHAHQSTEYTCFSVHNNNIMSSAVRGVVLSIDYDVSDATCSSRHSWIITTFASNVNIQKGNYKNRAKFSLKINYFIRDFQNLSNLQLKGNYITCLYVCPGYSDKNHQKT